jgi:hypothetical protein
MSKKIRRALLRRFRSRRRDVQMRVKNTNKIRIFWVEVRRFAIGDQPGEIHFADRVEQNRKTAGCAGFDRSARKKSDVERRVLQQQRQRVARRLVDDDAV